MKRPCDLKSMWSRRAQDTNLPVASKIASSVFEKKSPIILTGIIAISAVGYGMLRDNDLIFGIGIVAAIAGYLLIRRKLREHIRNNP